VVHGVKFGTHKRKDVFALHPHFKNQIAHAKNALTCAYNAASNKLVQNVHNIHIYHKISHASPA
jgi:hypothetical protein